MSGWCIWWKIMTKKFHSKIIWLIAYIQEGWGVKIMDCSHIYLLMLFMKMQHKNRSNEFSKDQVRKILKKKFQNCFNPLVPWKRYQKVNKGLIASWSITSGLYLELARNQKICLRYRKFEIKKITEKIKNFTLKQVRIIRVNVEVKRSKRL